MANQLIGVSMTSLCTKVNVAISSLFLGISLAFWAGTSSLFLGISLDRHGEV